MVRKRSKSGGKSRLQKKKETQLNPEQDIIILFVDVVGCSEISNHLKPEEYSTFITNFQDCFNKVCQYYKDNVYKIHEHHLFQHEPRGDEGCLKIFVSRSAEGLAGDVDVAISIALDLKRRWLFSKYNRNRIKSKLLPIELGIGIHLGKAWIKDGPKGKQPEGYVINLAKRIEGGSRNGKFTHILLSEAAHGQLHYSIDERVYKFTNAFPIPTKGISQEIRVFEIKHHFLPTDWMHVVEDKPWEISMVYPELSREDMLEIAKEAYQINPTNLWLAEEYLMLTMMEAYRKSVEQKKKEDIKYLKEAGYGKALEIAQRITNSVLRDGTLLSEWGLILGDLERFDEEEEKYREAIRIEESDPDFHWYLASCLSYKIAKDIKINKISLSDFYKQKQTKDQVKEVLKEYKTALNLSPMNSWIVYDYACELSQWSQIDKKLKEHAVEVLIRALSRNKDVKDWVEDEKYLAPIINDARIQKCLGSQ